VNIQAKDQVSDFNLLTSFILPILIDALKVVRVQNSHKARILDTNEKGRYHNGSKLFAIMNLEGPTMVLPTDDFLQLFHFRVSLAKLFDICEHAKEKDGKGCSSVHCDHGTNFFLEVLRHGDIV